LVEVIAMDHPGIVHEVASFFSDRQINIEDMETDTYIAPHTCTPMFTLSMTVSIPSSLSLSQLREDFYDFCDSQNLDATIEPVRIGG
jgi:glycine cleavage system transcriptional repressor